MIKPCLSVRDVRSELFKCMDQDAKLKVQVAGQPVNVTGLDLELKDGKYVLILTCEDHPVNNPGQPAPAPPAPPPPDELATCKAYLESCLPAMAAAYLRHGSLDAKDYGPDPETAAVVKVINDDIELADLRAALESCDDDFERQDIQEQMKDQILDLVRSYPR